MPPKLGKEAAVKRSGETHRLPGEEHVTMSAAKHAGALVRRPHHLVSRLHPPWSTSSNTGNGGGTGAHNLVPTHANKGVMSMGRSTVTSSSSTKVGALSRRRGGLTTRVAGRNPTGPKAERKELDASHPVQTSAVNSRQAAAVHPVGHKRSRSQSTSNPVEVDADDSEEDRVEEEDALRKTSSSEHSDDDRSPEASQASSSSVSSSSLPVVTESKVLHTSGGATAAQTVMKSTQSTTKQDGAQQEAPVAASAESCAAPAEVVTSSAASPSKLPPVHTAASTADSKVLFGDDEDEDKAPDDQAVLGSRKGATAHSGPAVSDSVSPLPGRAQETHVLGELSNRASVTPARPNRVKALSNAASGKRSPQRGRRTTVREREDADGEDEGELLGELLQHSSEAAIPVASVGDAYTSARERHTLFQQLIGEETENQTTSTSPATPSLLPTYNSISPGVECVAADAVVTHFAETLAVQDLSFLPDEAGTANTPVEALPILPSATEPRTPRTTPAANSTNCHSMSMGNNDEEGEAHLRSAKEVLLGDGLVSPPVTRGTATPRQAAQGTPTNTTNAACSIVVEGVTKTAGAPLASVRRELQPPPPFLARLNDSTTSDSSLLTPQTPSKVAVVARPGTDAAEASPTSSSSLIADDTAAAPAPHVSSLPSTVDDGCWKEEDDDDERTPLHTPPLSVMPAAATAREAASALQQETVPIDPFLTTPPQFRQGRAAALYTTALRDGGEVTPEGISATQKKAKSASPKRGRRSVSQSVTPPRTHAKHSIATEADRHNDNVNGGSGSACNGADIDPALLKVGTRVEGRWGRQWFPATVSEAPRNGFVQIQWAEDASLLHVRLREVRLPVEVLPPSSASTAAAKGGGKVGRTEGEVSAAPQVTTAVEGAVTSPPKEADGSVLTATQLVALMEEEDAEDSRHEVEHQQSTIHSSSNSAAGRAKRTTPTAQLCLDDNKEEVVVALDEGRDAVKRGSGRRRRSRGGSSTPPPPSSPSAGCSSAPPPASASAATAAGGAFDGTPSATKKDGVLLQQMHPLPFETVPASLCVFLAPSVRRELLQGTCGATSGVTTTTVTSTEVQRNTELQRILHFLTSAGATLISSLAQADNIAAQLGDGESTTPRFQRPPTNDLERTASLVERSASLPNVSNGTSEVGGSGGVAISAAAHRKTVGRVPLPRRSGPNPAMTSAAHPAAKRYFIFLVAGQLSSSSLSLSTTDASVIVPALHLPDVCVAHALGVSAIHASWLWSVVPGALHVRLPTAQDQLALPLDFAHSVGLATASENLAFQHAADGTSTSSVPPLRLTPFPSQQRWLSGKAVQFVERDDAMEVWLNAAGAVVTAEPPPPPPHPLTPPAPTALGTAGTDGDEHAVDPATAGTTATAAATAATRNRSCTATHHPQQEQPPRKQPCIERRPDYVYVRETGHSVPLDLNRLGDVPVLRLPWLVRGIELHYTTRFNTEAGTASDGGGAPPTAKDVAALTDAPPSLSSVWADVQRARAASASAAARSESRRELSTTATLREYTTTSPQGLRNDREPTMHADEHTTTANHTPTPTAVDGNSKLFDMRSPDARVPVADDKATTPVSNASTTTPQAPLPEDVSAAELHDAANIESNSGEREGVLPPIQDKNKEVLRCQTDGDDRDLAAAVDPLNGRPNQEGLLDSGATIVACTHPPITVGEDYYFSVAVPAPAAVRALPTQMQGMPAAQLTVPTATIALGRVVGIQCPTQRASPHAEPAPCCFVAMQLYEPKYVSMHVDPRNGDVVHQTSVYLSVQRVAVPAVSLLFNVPVYVVTASARQHIYLLEDEEDVLTSSRFTYPPTNNVGAVAVQSDTHPSHVGAVHYVSSPLSPRYAPTSTVSASPTPTSPIPLRSVVNQTARMQRDDGVDEDEGAVPLWATNTVDGKRTPAFLKAAGLQNNPSGTYAQNERGFIGKEPSDACSPISRTLDVAELGDRSPHSAVAVRHAVQGAQELPQQRRVCPSNAPRAARMLTQLLIDVGGRPVVVRPSSRVSFYARRSLSMSERQSHEGRRLGFGASRADSPSDFAITPVAQAAEEQPAAVNSRLRTSDSVSEHDSDSSEELIAEAPLVGQVELLREMDGTVDVVIHTAQPNSVFGGSKMYRVTPDMIVDVAP
jgi:hypothetical protein